MGIHRTLQKCHITDSPLVHRENEIEGVDYDTEYYGVKLYFKFEKDHVNSEFVESNKFVLKGLIINGKFLNNALNAFHNNYSLEKIILEANFPVSPKDKLDNLLNYIYSRQGNAGSTINLYNPNEHDFFLNRLFFKTHEEYWFYISALKEFGYITFIETASIYFSDAINVKMTYNGLNYIIEIQETGYNSKNCFIAISFSPSMDIIKETIIQTIIDCQFKPLIINRINYSSEITINDAIISNIKSCKFLVADFTEHKHGVYFEAGYALGRGKPVIYICRKDDFENAHFDTNHYPHILYNNHEDLKFQLSNKIKAWIE